MESTAPPNAKCRPPTKSCFESWNFFVTLNWLTKKAIYIQLKTYLAAIFFSLIMIHNLWFLEHFLIEFSIMQTKCIWSLQWDLIVREVFNWAWKIIWPFIGFASLDCLCPENLCRLLTKILIEPHQFLVTCQKINLNTNNTLRKGPWY